MQRWAGVVGLALLAAVPACKKKRVEESAPPVAELKPIAEPVVPVPEVPVPKEPVPSTSREVPSERGVPLDRTVLGSLPHPFGALEVLKQGMTRDEVLSALPNAQRDGESVSVPVGVEDLMAAIDFDFTDHLDVVRITVPDTARELLAKAWGKPTATDTWFDRKKRWRADLDGDNELMIGPFTPLAEVLGKGPDGLAETKAMIGATPAELTARFGARIKEVPVENDDGEATGEKRFELLLPATEHCKFFTHLDGELAGGRIAKLHLGQCYGDEAGRRAALASMERAWGRAVPGRSADDHPVFTFALPGRKIEMALDEEHADHPGWQLVISAK
jgi:hypothetical protein